MAFLPRIKKFPCSGRGPWLRGGSKMPAPLTYARPGLLPAPPERHIRFPPCTNGSAHRKRSPVHRQRTLFRIFFFRWQTYCSVYDKLHRTETCRYHPANRNFQNDCKPCGLPMIKSAGRPFRRLNIQSRTTTFFVRHTIKNAAQRRHFAKFAKTGFTSAAA